MSRNTFSDSSKHFECLKNANDRRNEREICCSESLLKMKWYWLHTYFVYFHQQLAKKNEQMWKQLDQQNKELEEKRKQFEREKAQYEEEQKNSGQKGLERSDSSSKSLK